jgi:hypothetical protein
MRIRPIPLKFNTLRTVALVGGLPGLCGGRVVNGLHQPFADDFKSAPGGDLQEFIRTGGGDRQRFVCREGRGTNPRATTLQATG